MNKHTPYTKKSLMSLFNENGIVISNDVWNRWVGFGLLPLGYRPPTGKRGGKEKFYPDNIVSQIDTILDLENREWPRHSLIVTLFVLGYEIDWDKLRSYFIDYLSDFEQTIQVELPDDELEVPYELTEKILQHVKKHHHFPSRGNPSAEQSRIRDEKIKQELSDRLAFLSMAPTLLGQRPRTISKKLMPFVNKQFIQWWGNLNNAEKPVWWLQIPYWSKKIDKMSVSDWKNIQLILQKLYYGYLKQILETTKFPDAMLKLFIRADFASLYVLPLTRASFRRFVNVFLNNEEILLSFQGRLAQSEEGGDSE